MTGFFPIFMFGLPAAALAIWRTAHPSQKKLVGGIMLSAALTSFIHRRDESDRVLVHVRGVAAVPDPRAADRFITGLVNALGIHDGLQLLAGSIDYIINFRYRRPSPVVVDSNGLLYD